MTFLQHPNLYVIISARKKQIDRKKPSNGTTNAVNTFPKSSGSPLKSVLWLNGAQTTPQFFPHDKELLIGDEVNPHCYILTWGQDTVVVILDICFVCSQLHHFLASDQCKNWKVQHMGNLSDSLLHRAWNHTSQELLSPDIQWTLSLTWGVFFVISLFEICKIQRLTQCQSNCGMQHFLSRWEATWYE